MVQYMDEGCLATMLIDVVCNACRRNFKRECNKAYHKCITERSVQGQAGTACALQLRWFRSRVALAVCRCREEEVATAAPQASAPISVRNI